MGESANLPDCTGDDCFKIAFETSDPVAETWWNDSDPDKHYVMPKMGLFNLVLVPDLLGMDAAFNQQAEKEMAKYKGFTRGCKQDCKCSLSQDPKDTITTTARQTVRATYTKADGDPATVTGTFQLKTTKTKGICVPNGERRWF